MTDTSGAPWLKYQAAGTSSGDATPGPWSKYQTAKSTNPPPQEKSVSGDRGFVQGLRDYAGQQEDFGDMTKRYAEGAPEWIRNNVMPVVALPEAITRKAGALGARALASTVQGTEDLADVAYQKDDLHTRALNAQIARGKAPEDITNAISLGASPFSPKAPIQGAIADVAQSAAKKPIEMGAKAADIIREGPIRAEPRPGVQGMRDAGFVLTPETASEKPGALSSVLSGVSGDLKSQQLASVKNQKIAQSFAARDMGLPPDTLLKPDVLNSVISEEGKAYQAVRSVVPEVTPTAEFKAATKDFGGNTELLSEHFPSSAENKDVAALRAEMKNMGPVPTNVLVDKIKALRFDAKQNFKALGSPEKWRLAMAQRDAANAMDDLLDKSISDAPNYFAGKVKEADKAIGEAQADIAKDMADPKLADHPFGPELLQSRLQSAQQRLAAATESKAANTERLAAAKDPQSQISQVHARYKQARQRIAKAHDYEAVVNPETGEISPRALAAMARKGKPLTGGARAIANAALTAPKVMRVPSEFGGAKNYSVLDFGAAMAALGHGNVPLAAVALSRPGLRHVLLSDTYQNLMVPQTKSILRDLGTEQPDAGSILQQLGQSDAP